jgi:uncharacterized protein (TIGR02996 family)
MSDEDALLSAIIANPDEDTPRLVYADWLDENGQPERAEFIRVQIELESVELGSPEHLALRRRQAIILSKHRDQWLRQLPRSLEAVRYHFRRGFAEIGEVDSDRLGNHPRGFAFANCVREVIARNAQINISSLSRRAGTYTIRLRGRLDHGEASEPVLVDLLRQSPRAIEPFLLRGRWLILCWAVWSEPDRRTAHLLGILHRNRRLPIQVGIRPFDEFDEFETWCNPQTLSGTSPIWLVFEDGSLTHEEVGLQPPLEFRDGWGIS